MPAPHKADPEAPDVHATDRATTCFGYEVRSGIALRYLRPGTGVPLEVSVGSGTHEPVSEPVRRWVPRSGHPFEADLYYEDDLFHLWIKGTGWYEIEPIGPSIRVPPHADGVQREERLWGFPAALCFIHRGDLPLHAAAVEAGGRALLLAAPGRFGKTTLAAAFLRAGHRVLSEDISCCHLAEKLSVIPGPAMLRIRHDTFARFEFPGTERVGEDHDRVHLALDRDARGDALPVPLHGIVFLRASDGTTSLDRVRGEAAIQDLWALSFKLSTETDRIRCFEAVVNIADRTPIWNLSRPLDYATTGDVVQRLLDTCLEP